MSRIGRAQIAIPAGVEVTVGEGRVTVKGPRGDLSLNLPGEMKLVQEDNQLRVERPSDSGPHRSLHGLTRTLVANMVIGVTQGFTKQLDLVGVGYRAAKQGEDLMLSLGFSHPVRFPIPTGVSVEVPDPARINLTSNDKELVGQTAANIRKFRPPEPYKGKGILYRGEVLKRKAGKAGKGK